MAVPGPWTTPPEQINANVARDGTPLTDPYHLYALTFLESSQQVTRSDEAFLGATFPGEPTNALATDMLTQLLAGAPDARISFNHTPGQPFMFGLIVPPDIPFTPALRSAMSLGGYVRHVPVPQTYVPPDWDADPNVIDIEFRGDNVLLDQWVALCSWFEDANGESYEGTTAGITVSDNNSLMSIDWMRLREGVEYEYTSTGSGFVGHPGNNGPLGEYAAVGRVTPTIFDGQTLGSDPANPLASTAGIPRIDVIDLHPEWIDSRGAIAFSAESSAYRLGFDPVWEWLKTVQDFRQSWDGAFRFWPGIRYQPQDYRLIYDIAPPQRKYPRDDGFSISTKRSWPQRTSRQYSQRKGPSGTYW